MKNLFNLLERFSKVLNKDAAVKEAIIKVIQERTRVALSPEQFLFKDGVLTVNASPVAKNEINLKEDAIKSELRELYRLPVSRIVYK